MRSGYDRARRILEPLFLTAFTAPHDDGIQANLGSDLNKSARISPQRWRHWQAKFKSEPVNDATEWGEIFADELARSQMELEQTGYASVVELR